MQCNTWTLGGGGGGQGAGEVIIEMVAEMWGSGPYRGGSRPNRYGGREAVPGQSKCRRQEEAARCSQPGLSRHQRITAGAETGAMLATN